MIGIVLILLLVAGGVWYMFAILMNKIEAVEKIPDKISKLLIDHELMIREIHRSSNARLVTTYELSITEITNKIHFNNERILAAYEQNLQNIKAALTEHNEAKRVDTLLKQNHQIQK